MDDGEATAVAATGNPYWLLAACCWTMDDRLRLCQDISTTRTLANIRINSHGTFPPILLHYFSNSDCMMTDDSGTGLHYKKASDKYTAVPVLPVPVP